MDGRLHTEKEEEEEKNTSKGEDWSSSVGVGSVVGGGGDSTKG